MWPALRATVAAAAGAAVLLAQVNLPSREFWENNSSHSHLLYPCIGLLALQEIAIFLGSGLRAEAARQYDNNLLAALHAGIKVTGERFALSWDKVGVHVFLARRRFGLLRLVKVAGVRMSTEPSLVRSDWRPGKGIVGVAWRSEAR
ncbi:hypothetical protein [Dactylosporangium salmoneum]|uniref:Uncharacterized protein n=1 Tax=Dactylosporangium salmoneum TaxID=53361 RepID=A0ABN3G6Z7_9ACTN